MPNPIPQQSFEMMRTEHAGLPLVRMRGRLTIGEASKSLRACMAGIGSEGHKRVLLDMAEVTYMDSAGLGALVAGYNLVKSGGGTVGLFKVPKRIRDLIEMSGLTAVFRIYETEQDAAAAAS